MYKLFMNRSVFFPNFLFYNLFYTSIFIEKIEDLSVNLYILDLEF